MLHNPKQLNFICAEKLKNNDLLCISHCTLELNELRLDDISWINKDKIHGGYVLSSRRGIKIFQKRTKINWNALS